MEGGSRFAFKLASLLTVVGLLVSAQPVAAVTVNDLKAAESKLGSTREKIREGDANKERLTSEIKAADTQMGTLEGQLRALDGQVGKAREAKNAVTAELNTLRAQLAESQGEPDRATARLTKLTITLNRRAGSVYKNGDVSFLEVLLEARDFTDFVSRFRFLQAIMNLDARLVREIKATKAKIEKARARIEKNKVETEAREEVLAAEVRQLEGFVSSQLAKRNEVKASINAKEQLMRQIDADREAWQEAEAELLRSAERIRQQLARGGSSPVVGTPSTTGFIWPASGPVTSGFGMRWGKMHEGIDIAVPYGAPVYASKAGRVEIADWYGGYGNVVVIDHGGGVTTWYGHNSSFTVGVGDYVSQGQQIARAGSTGNSTGPHVHFEIRINGQAQNPMNYLP